MGNRIFFWILGALVLIVCIGLGIWAYQSRPALIIAADVEKIVSAKVQTYANTVNTSLSAQATRITSLETTVGNDRSGLVADVDSIGARLDETTSTVEVLQQANANRLNAEWIAQEPVRLKASGECWEVLPAVRGGERGFTFKLPKKAKKANLQKVCEAFAQKYKNQSGLGYNGIQSAGQDALVKAFFTKKESAHFLPVDLGAEQYAVIAKLLAKQRGKINRVAGRLAELEPIDKAENDDPKARGWSRDGQSPASATTAPVTQTAAATATATAPVSFSIKSGSRSIRARRLVSASPAQTSFGSHEHGRSGVANAISAKVVNYGTWGYDGQDVWVDESRAQRECGGEDIELGFDCHILNCAGDECSDLGDKGWRYHKATREGGRYRYRFPNLPSGTLLNFHVRGKRFLPDSRHSGEDGTVDNNKGGRQYFLK